MTPPAEISPDEARAYLVGQLGLAAPTLPAGPEGVRALLGSLRCIQLDPLDVIGTNADLVALARVDGIARGDVFRHVFPGHAFEHFAKERCLLPATAFPYYRGRAAEATWWGLAERLRRLPEGIVADVLAEVDARGPISARDLTDRGAVQRMDWSGWKGTPRATAMALEVLWTRCEIVICGRERDGKVVDVPRRALPQLDHGEGAAVPGTREFQRWALIERVEAAGLLSRAGGPYWSMLSDARTSPLPDALLREGAIDEVTVAGSSRRFLAPRGFRDRAFPEPDDRMRILGPLDPLLWDRALVRHAFGFEYVWEVYKPPEERRWGWYVCPLLHRGRLVARIEAKIEEGALRVDRIWRERGVKLDDAALDEALARHAAACGATRVRRPRKRS
jgi:hypothetical protein